MLVLNLTMKLINSDTHSWTHSLASFETLAVCGSEFFMILATFAIYTPQLAGVDFIGRKELTGSQRSCSRNSSTCASVKAWSSGA